LAYEAIAAMMLATLLPASAMAGELWCPAPDNAYSFTLEIDADGYTTRTRDRETRCTWTNSGQTGAICPYGWYGRETETVRVFIERNGDVLRFDQYGEFRQVTPGPQPFVRCTPEDSPALF
jgi:hypothetical protein